MINAKIILIGICLCAIVSGALAYKTRMFEYVWIADGLSPNLGCTIKLTGYTLEPNPAPVAATFVSPYNTTTCQMHVIYVGE